MSSEDGSLLIEYWLNGKRFAIRRRSCGVPRVGDEVRISKGDATKVVVLVVWHEADTDTLSQLGTRVCVMLEDRKR